MIEDIDELGINGSAEDIRSSLSTAEVEYIDECVEGGNPSALVDRIDEFSTSLPPKGIDSDKEISAIIEPIKDQIDSKYLEAPTDVEQIEAISDYLVNVENLDYASWQKLSVEERIETIQNAENKIAEIEHRNPCPIKVQQLSSDTYGYFSPINKTITLNLTYLSNPSEQSYRATLDTLVHEGRHAYQDYNMNEREVHQRSGEVNMWKWNNDEVGYQNAILCGFKAYAMQPVETDARAFAEDVLTSYFKKKA
jgi:hypothetical protein